MERRSTRFAIVRKFGILVGALVLGVGFLTGCGSSDTTGQATATAAPITEGEISGTWHGSSASDKHAERMSTFTVVFSQDGNRISGPITIEGGCISEGSITGTFSGRRIEFGVIENSGVEFTGTLSGDSLSGSFASHPPCGPDNDTGTWKATRASVEDTATSGAPLVSGASQATEREQCWDAATAGMQAASKATDWTTYNRFVDEYNACPGMDTVGPDGTPLYTRLSHVPE